MARTRGFRPTASTLSYVSLAHAAAGSLNEPWGEMMSKHERLSNRHRSHHLVFCSPRVFVCNGQKFADLAYDVVFTHGSLITVFVSR